MRDMIEEMLHDSYGLIQHCSGVTKVKHAEKKAYNDVFGKCIFSPCDDSCTGRKIYLLLVDT